MNEFDIRHEQDENAGRYVIDLEPGLIAEMTYQRKDPSTIAIDHTRVPPQYRGKNIAGQLMKFAIDQARNNNDRIIPVCSYVQLQFRRHKDWADLLAP